MQPEKNFAQKLLVYSIVLVLGLLLLSRAYTLLTTSAIHISTTANDAVIKIVKIDNHTTVASSKAGEKELSIRLKPGEYTLSATSRVSSVSITKTVRARQAVTQELNPKILLTAEPVNDNKSTGIIVGGDQLLFVNAATGGLTKIDSQNNLISLDTTHHLISAQWADVSHGLAMDDNYNIYSILGGLVAPLEIPINTTGNPSSSYSVSPNGTFYVSNGQDVYSGSLGDFKKIYSLGGDRYSTAVAASDTAVAVIERNGASGGNDSTVSIVTDGQVQAKLSVDAGLLSWSPDGKHLLIVKRDGQAYIYDNQLHRQSSVPTSKINNPTWINNEVLAYAAGNALWTYNTSSTQSEVIAQFTPGYSVTNIIYDHFRDSIYMGTTSSSGGVLQRFNLKSKSLPPYIYQLDSYLPVALDQCVVDYVNFTRPIILLSPYDSSLVTACQENAKIRLRQYSLPTNTLTFITNQPNDQLD